VVLILRPAGVEEGRKESRMRGVLWERRGHRGLNVVVRVVRYFVIIARWIGKPVGLGGWKGARR